MIQLRLMISKNDLDYLSTLKNVAIFGASGAIGSAFIDVFSSIDSIENIYAFSRSNASFSSQKVVNTTFDYLDESTLINAKDSLSSSVAFDLILITTGMLHSNNIMPEKSLSEFDSEKLNLIFYKIQLARVLYLSILVAY